MHISNCNFFLSFIFLLLIGTHIVRSVVLTKFLSNLRSSMLWNALDYSLCLLIIMFSFGKGALHALIPQAVRDSRQATDI